MQVIRDADTAVIIETHGTVDDSVADLAWIRDRL